MEPERLTITQMIARLYRDHWDALRGPGPDLTGLGLRATSPLQAGDEALAYVVRVGGRWRIARVLGSLAEVAAHDTHTPCCAIPAEHKWADPIRCLKDHEDWPCRAALTATPAPAPLDVDPEALARSMSVEDGLEWDDWDLLTDNGRKGRTMRAASILARLTARAAATEPLAAPLDSCVCQHPKVEHYFGDRLGDDGRMHSWCQMQPPGHCTDYRRAATEDAPA